MIVEGSLGAAKIESLLQPYLGDALHPSNLFEQLAAYLELLLKWNARTNLTSIRQPGEIVKRHFGESLFAGQHIGECETLLDFGSGAGFPGLPIQLMRPDIRVTLAESQNKKSTFLREVLRTLSLGTEIWADRAESLPVSRGFDVVTLRAVDNMEAAMIAASRIDPSRLAILSTANLPPVPASFRIQRSLPMPESEHGHLVLLERLKVT